MPNSFLFFEISGLNLRIYVEFGYKILQNLNKASILKNTEAATQMSS